MKKSIICILSVFILFNIVLNHIQRPTQVNKDFKNALVVKDGEILNKVDVKINANLRKSDFLFKDLEFKEDLNGHAFIDNEKYYLDASNLKKHTNNCMWGDLSEDINNNNCKFTLFMMDDLNSLYLINDEEDYRIFAPATNLDDCNKIRSKLRKNEN